MNKQWYKSKAVWSAIGVGIIGVLTAIGIPVPVWVTEILAALGIVGIRTAIK